MEWRSSLPIAVVAQDTAPSVRALRRQLLRRQNLVQHPKIHRHVAHRFTTNGARVIVPRVLLKARGMHEMSAWQLPNGQRTREQVLPAHRTTRFKAVLPALVPLVQGQAHTRVAVHAVKHVLPQPLAPPAHIAELAVVD